MSAVAIEEFGNLKPGSQVAFSPERAEAFEGKIVDMLNGGRWR